MVTPSPGLVAGRARTTVVTSVRVLGPYSPGLRGFFWARPRKMSGGVFTLYPCSNYSPSVRTCGRGVRGIAPGRIGRLAPNCARFARFGKVGVARHPPTPGGGQRPDFVVRRGVGKRPA